MLVPGFIDSHIHASAGGLGRIRCDLSEAHSLGDYLAAVRGYAERNPAAAWITGGGWSMDVFPGGYPAGRISTGSSPTARYSWPTATSTRRG